MDRRKERERGGEVKREGKGWSGGDLSAVTLCK